MSEAIASKAERLAAYNANIAAAEKDPSLSPETGKPLSKMNAARFGAGFLVFGVLWMSGLGIVPASAAVPRGSSSEPCSVASPCS